MASAIQKPSHESTAKDEDDNQLTWTKEIVELLVIILYKVFSEEGATNNSFKKATF